MTKNKKLPAGLIRLLLLIAGIEQNPGPWFCPVCTKHIGSTSVQCSTCLAWLHVKCSSLKTSKERKKYDNWTGPCCKTTTIPPISRTPPPLLISNKPPPISISTKLPPISISTKLPRNKHSFHPPTPLNPPPPPPHNPPPPQQQPNLLPNSGYNSRILQYNINGIIGKIDELLHYMEYKKILIAAIQETKMTDKSKSINTPNYTFVRQDRGTDKGGGLAFLVHKDVHFTLEKTPTSLSRDPNLESMTISIPGDESPLKIRNVYIPPQSSCAQGYIPKLDELYEDLGDTFYVLGDLNAHHDLWLSNSTPDTRGNALADSIANLDCGIINENLPTRITPTATTSPDISIASSNLLPVTNWSVEKRMSSDHLPIIISLTAELKKSNSKPYTYINFSKANWQGFQDLTEKIFEKARPVTNIHKAEKHFRKTLQRAARKYIPAGRLPKTYNALPTDAAKLIDKRDELRNNNPADPRLNDLNNEINQKINEHRKNKWQEHLANCSPGSKKLWSTIKSLNNGPRQPDNQGITFDGKSFLDAKKIANKFNHQYTPPISKKPQQELRKTLRSMKKKAKHQPVIFTPAQTLAAIKKAKNSKALGPDNLSPIMLKNLGPHAINFLTEIFNKCLKDSIIPSIWKTAKIIPLLKPGKASDLGPSYRPVSLLPPAIKILEALLLPLVNAAIHLADRQHGFRKRRSTTTVLQSILSHINTGLNQKKPVQRTISINHLAHLIRLTTRSCSTILTS